jgi:hypothetical protein
MNYSEELGIYMDYDDDDESFEKKMVEVVAVVEFVENPLQDFQEIVPLMLVK